MSQLHYYLERNPFHMTLPLSSTTPAKLYAFQLKLRPIERGTIMPFSGELVHAAWLEWIRAAAPDVATFLHDGNKRRLFTCSSLQFPLPIERVREAEREHLHLPLDPEKTYTVRITLLHGELFPLFYNSLMHFNMARSGTKVQPFMQLGKQSFLLEEVISDPDDRSGWTGFTSYASLVEKARTLRLGSAISLELEFASLTTCSWTNKAYGNYYAMLPLPEFIFPPLARRWQDLAPSELTAAVQEDRIAQYIQEDGMVIEDHDLKSHHLRFVNHPQRGFIGTCKYQLRGPDDAVPGENLLTVRQQIILLAQLAFYTGIGYKTAMGMGQVRLM